MILLLVGVINLPFAHRIITNKVNDILRENGLPVHVGKLSLLLNGKIGLSQLEVKSLTGDTIIYAGNVNISVSPGPLFSNRIVIQNVELGDIVVNLQADKNTGKLVLLSLFPPSSETSKNKTKAKKSWDIEIHQAHLNNIRFLYNDSLKGILVEQTLHKADLTFDTFSILKKQIDVNYLRIEKANGHLSISKSNSDTVQTVSSTAPWKFSARNLELKDIIYEFDQPDSKQKTSASLKHADISVKTLNLFKRELDVLQIKLVDPNVVIETSGATSTNNIVEEPEKKISTDNPWSLMCGLIKIENGTFLYNNKKTDQKNDFAQWMPVEEFNTTIKDVKYNAEGYRFNMNELSLGLNHQAFIKSGAIVLVADSSQKGKLKLELIASANMEHQKLFTKNDVIKLSSAFSGSPDSLQIEKCNINCTSGINVSVSGYITELLKMPDSRCKLNFKTRTITRDQTSELIALSGTRVNLPNFEPVAYSGTIDNSFLKPQFKISMQSASGDIALDGNYDVNNKNGNLDATLSQVRLRSIFGDAYPESVTCSVSLNGGMNNKEMLSGDGVIEINSALYNGGNYQNIELDLSVIDNQSTFTLISNDSALTCNLNGLFDWNDNMYKGKLSGHFNLNEGNTNLLPGQLAVQGEIESDFKNSGKNLQSSVDFKNIAISNLNSKANLDSFSCKLNMTNSLVSTQVKSDFFAADFQSQSSFDELKKAIESVHFEKALSLDSADFLKLNSVTTFPVFNLTATVNYHSIFQLFYPDSVFNFDTVHIAINKKAEDNIVQGEISYKGFNYLNYQTYRTEIQMKFDEHKLNCKIILDSLDAEGMLLGSSSFALDILPASMIGSLSVSNRDRDSMPLYQIGAEAIKENNRLVLKSTEGDWVINSNKWTLSPSEFLTRENSSKDIVADIHLQHDDMKIELVGRQSESLKLNLKNVLLSKLISPELIKDLPDGSINANVVYGGGDRKNLDFKFDIAQFKWKDVFLDSIGSIGKIVSDTSGILETEITATLNDTSTITIKSEPRNNPSAKSFHSTFSNVPVKLLQPSLGEYIDSLQGTISGEIVLAIENNKPTMDGEIKLRQVYLNVIPLKSGFSIPDDKLMIKKSQLNFDHFTVLDSMQKPLHLNGTINL
ncbi:MAG: hypothetical protein ABI723_13930, partial [Bacteroidia bacterium]